MLRPALSTVNFPGRATIVRMRLHITNGDSTVPGIRFSDPSGTVLPWRDVLHEGPVPSGVGADLLAEIRSAFLGGDGYAGFDSALSSFRERNDLVRRATDFEEVVLWFEHDLYDQLQLVEVLAAQGVRRAANVTLICIDSFPGIDRFVGLGQLSNEQIATLFPARIPVGDAQFELAGRVWNAFRRSDPASLDAVRREDTRALPFLGSALRRLLEELPDSATGLSKTESAVLLAVSGGGATPLSLFRTVQDSEEAPFLGDSTFWTILGNLANGDFPLIEAVDGNSIPRSVEGFRDRAVLQREVRATGMGRKVMAGEADHVRLKSVDRWLGGTRLHARNIWRWDSRAQSVVRPG